jgi:hypothetical protein
MYIYQLIAVNYNHYLQFFLPFLFHDSAKKKKKEHGSGSFHLRYVK